MSQNSKNRGALVVLSVAFTVSTLMGVFAYKRYVESEDFILMSLDLVQKEGQSLSGDGCVDYVVKWTHSCEAMKSLCDHSVPRLMQTCLQASSRSLDCVPFENIPSDARIGMQECKARSTTRADQKNCTTSYMVWNDFCKSQQIAGRN